MDVVRFSGGGRAFDGDEAKGTNFRKHEKQAGKRPRADASLAPVIVPVIFRGHGGHHFLYLDELRSDGVGRLALAMKECDGVSDAGNKGTNSKAISAHVDAAAALAGEVLIEPVCLIEGYAKLTNGNFKPDVAQVMNRRDTMLRNVVDIEGKLGTNMLASAFSVVHFPAVLRAELGKFDRDSQISSERMAFGVTKVMRQRADRERKLVGILRIAKEIDDEVTGAHIVGEVRKRRIAEGIITDVLNDAATIGVSPSAVKVGGSQVGITAEQQWSDRVIPSEIDQLLVGEQGIRCSMPTEGGQKEDKQDEGDKLPTRFH